MKKLVYLLVLFAGIANAQIVNIPDANFKAKLLTTNSANLIAYDLSHNLTSVDSNSNGEIEYSEAANISNLELYQSGIADLTGLEAFVNLTSLNVASNTALTVINTSTLPNLNSLTASNCAIASLDFSNNSNLTYLLCDNNQLTSLNVTGLTTLTYVDCFNNQLTSLDLSSATSLGNLKCYNNQLTTLLLNCPTTLNYLDCSNNQLTSLNVAGYNQFSRLRCNNNQLTSLNVSGFPYLMELYCDNNPLSNLNFTNCPTLDTVDCSNTLLTSIDLTGIVGLNNYFYCSNSLISSFIIPSMIYLGDIRCLNNQLTILDLTNIRLGYGDFAGNPLQTIYMKNGIADYNSFDTAYLIGSVQYVCADESEIVNVRNTFASVGNTTVVINSYCTFTPGGNFNTITGTMTFDANNDGCDASDLPKSNVRVNINDGTNSGAGFTNNSGNYAFYTQAGTFTLTPNIENPTWFTFSPPTAVIPFANNNNNTTTQNFCITANGIHPDVEVVIVPIAWARPGFDAQYKIVYKNKGNQTLSGNVTFSYDDAVLDFVSSTVIPTSQSTGSLNYDYTNLLPFENRSFYITLNVNAPTDTPPVNIGDNLNFTATVNPIAGDEIPSDNTFQYNQTVVGSFDPNDITCIEGNIVSPAEIGNYLHYVINFENTGTADAENIVVKDIIDTTQFDVNSLQVLNSSAPVTARLTGNVAEFIFPNINLHSGGHGNILIKIKSKSTLVQGDTVSKKGSIYFDYNAPIDTNLENTTFQALNIPDHEIDNTITIYPNPTKGNVIINCNNNINSIQLYDVQGRLLQTDIVNQTSKVIDISSRAKGVYFLKVLSDKGTLVQKIIKE